MPSSSQAVGGELRVVMPSPHVPRVFKAIGLDRVIKIFSTLPAAVVPIHGYPDEAATGQFPG
jgi:anti-anti-sigma regulatory factor